MVFGAKQRPVFFCFFSEKTLQVSEKKWPYKYDLGRSWGGDYIYIVSMSHFPGCLRFRDPEISWFMK